LARAQRLLELRDALVAGVGHVSALCTIDRQMESVRSPGSKERGTK
jgi:hypothetical protein